MVTVKIEDQDREEKALHVAIGLVVFVLLFYLWFTGTLSSLVSVAMPEPTDDKVAGTYDFITELLGDLLGFVGALTIAVFSSAWKLAIGGISFLMSRFNASPSESEVEKLRADSVYTTQQISTKLQSHEDRIVALEQPVTPVKVARTTTAKPKATRKAVTK